MKERIKLVFSIMPAFYSMLLILIGLSSSAQAQSIPQAIIEETTPLQAGLSATEVMELFGAPDRVLKNTTENDMRWLYGASMIFFLNEHVTAWTNNGELDRKYEQKYFTSSAKPRYKYFYEIGWSSAYAPMSEHYLDIFIKGLD